MYDFPIDQSLAPQITLGDPALLTLKNGALELYYHPINGYATAPQEARIDFGEPIDGHQGWAAAQVVRSIPAGTKVEYRLEDTAGAVFYWSGAAWALAVAPADWCSHDDLQDGITAWTDPIILHVLLTPDSKGLTTPSVDRVLLLYSGSFGVIDNTVYRSFARWFKGNVRPERRVVFKSPGGNTFALTDLGLPDEPEGYTATEVYDLTSDPERLTDMFQAFDPTTKVTTLTAPVAVDADLYVVYTFQPDLRFVGSQRYLEFAGVPVGVVVGIDRADRRQIVDACGMTISEARGEGVVFEWATVQDYRITLDLVAEGGVDLLAFCEAFDRLTLDEEPFILAPDGIKRLRTEPATAWSPDSGKVRQTSRFLVTIYSVGDYGAVRTKTVVSNFDLSLGK